MLYGRSPLTVKDPVNPDNWYKLIHMFVVNAKMNKIRDLFKVKLYAIRFETKRERERECEREREK